MILNERGERVGSSAGPGTNPWIIGFEVAAEELAKMVVAAKEDAGIPRDQPLESLVGPPLNALLCATCMSLSLCVSAGNGSEWWRAGIGPAKDH